MKTNSQELFAALPRMPLAPLNTPVQELRFLRTLFPNSPRVFIKRDDFIGPMVWGNKLRKLEYTLAEARRLGADTLITTGGMQSNHARTTAQVAREKGFDIKLVLNGTPPEKACGNYLINKKLGVEIHCVADRQERIPKMEKLANELHTQGRIPYIIPLGASDEFGTPGFIHAMKELREQEKLLGFSFDHILHASSSGGTQAGLIAGKKLYKLKANIIGMSADSSYEELSQAIHQAADPVLKKIRAPFQIEADDIQVETNYIGTGYGIPTKESIETEKLFAERAGILLDQTYTAKAMAGVIDYLKKGRFKEEETVLFWHTGGTIAVFQ